MSDANHDTACCRTLTLKATFDPLGEGGFFFLRLELIVELANSLTFLFSALSRDSEIRCPI